MLLKNIDAVLLDMDGTLLDLHYDTHFWMHHVPMSYAKIKNVSIKQAEQKVWAEYKKVSGTLSWYCYDYWSEVLGIDIHALQHETKDKVNWRADAKWFLDELKRRNIPAFILTNAHPSGIQLKSSKTQVIQFVNAVISSHDINFPKEELAFWEHVKKALKVDFSRCLFLDDSEKILSVAKRAGVGKVLGINTPDSHKPAHYMQDFDSIDQFKELF